MFLDLICFCVFVFGCGRGGGVVMRIFLFDFDFDFDFYFYLKVYGWELIFREVLDDELSCCLFEIDFLEVLL